MTHYEVLGYKRQSLSGVEVIKSDRIDIRRRPSQILHFSDPDSFMDALVGKSNIVIHVGREMKDGEATDNWKGYYWEASDPKKEYGYMEGQPMIPLGSLVILDMTTEFDLDFALEPRQQDSRRWLDLFERIASYTQRIRRVDRDHEYADSDRFRYQTSEELEKTLEKIKTILENLTARAATTLAEEEEGIDKFR